MLLLKFILLLLIPLNISAGDCQSNIILTKGQNVCFGQDFTITCQFNCSGDVKLMKDGKEIKSDRSAMALNQNFTLVLHIDNANQSHSGKYSCQSESLQFISMTSVKVDDCAVTSANTSSPLNSTNQSSTLLGTKKPVLIGYLLFKTGFFLIGSIAALTTVCQKQCKPHRNQTLRF